MSSVDLWIKSSLLDSCARKSHFGTPQSIKVDRGKRKKDVLKSLSEGLSTQDTADKYGISYETVRKIYKTNEMEKQMLPENIELMSMEIQGVFSQFESDLREMNKGVCSSIDSLAGEVYGLNKTLRDIAFNVADIAKSLEK